MNDLFRIQVLDLKKHKNFGSISINTPLNYKIYALGYAVFLFCILLIVTFVDFSQKYSVKGYLNSTAGVVSIYPKKIGTISQILVKQGSIVARGSPLFKIETSDETHPTHIPKILKQLNIRKMQVMNEITRKENLLKRLKTLLAKQFISVQDFNHETENLNDSKERLNSIQLEIIRYQQEQSYIIHAPIAGSVATLNSHLGQHVDSTKPLLKLMPTDAKLTAELFIPVREAGFIRLNDQIMLHYDAYPYQHFGGFSAHIQSITQSILLDEEDSKPMNIGEPYYKAYATVDSPMIKLYGKNKALQPGMTFSAVVSGSQRKIWQWLFDPLYSFNGGFWS